MIPIQAHVAPEHRIKVGVLVGIDYGLGPGSGLELPMKLCLCCGQVQGNWPADLTVR